MCRIVVYAGERGPVAPVMYGGEHSLHDQSFRPKELMDGSLNADGYSVAWYHEGQPVRVADDRPIWQNADLEQMLARCNRPWRWRGSEMPLPAYRTVSLRSLL